MTDLAVLEASGACPARLMAAAEEADNAEMQSKAAALALRLADAAAPLAEREMRPLGDTLPGWFAYRGPDRLDPASGNRTEVLLAMRAPVVRRRLGHLPDRPTILVSLPGPTPEES